jgi:hypothetical protein
MQAHAGRREVAQPVELVALDQPQPVAELALPGDQRTLDGAVQLVQLVEEHVHRRGEQRIGDGEQADREVRGRVVMAERAREHLHHTRGSGIDSMPR